MILAKQYENIQQAVIHMNHLMYSLKIVTVPLINLTPFILFGINVSNIDTSENSLNLFIELLLIYYILYWASHPHQYNIDIILGYRKALRQVCIQIHN